MDHRTHRRACDRRAIKKRVYRDIRKSDILNLTLNLTLKLPSLGSLLAVLLPSGAHARERVDTSTLQGRVFKMKALLLHFIFRYTCFTSNENQC